MSPFRFFSIYRTSHLHFTSNYDMFKYGGKSRSITPDSFDARKDKQRFVYWADKIENPDDALKLCVFNFLNGSNWFYESYEEARDVSLERKKFYSSFMRNIAEDGATINAFKELKKADFQSLIRFTPNGNMPPLLQLQLQGRISREFVCLLNRDKGFVEESWIGSNDPLVKDEAIKIVKYAPFVILFSKRQ